MQLFGKCLFHRFERFNVYYDCSDICFWSSGTEEYKFCKDCHVSFSKSSYDKEWNECSYNDILRAKEYRLKGKLCQSM